MINLKESNQDEYTTYTHEELVQAVREEVEADMMYDDEEDAPTLGDVLDMLHDNQGVEAALSDHPQHEELVRIISDVVGGGEELEEAASPTEGIYKYIQDLKTVENDVASHVRFNNRNGYAHFWWNEEGYYTLVVVNDAYESTPEDTKYWGDEELQDVNDIQLTAEQLYDELKSLDGVELDNFYGLNILINDNEY